ncbi:MAG TPA: globin domain-containing protein [Vicinamibacterales bacterium]|nr:globin domain-containing protein [Vicinamibacterales bacterium]
MTAEQRRLVRDSFDAMRELAEPVTLMFYGKLFELDPSARRLFHNDLTLQGRKLIDTLDTVIQSLDRFDEVRPRLIALGRQHAEYGVRPEQYAMITAALIWALGQALGADFDPPTREAWTAALNAVTAVMRGAPQVG